MSESTSEAGHKNRLAREISPYLLLHQANPVDWYPWGEEALERARREDKPIFLSVGYSTCYWCHVMERESFSDPGTAELMNARFINVKVDREERPEIDEIYMAATQLLTHQGGWPNSVFLLPDLRPYFAGTYFPPEDRQGLPGFRRVLVSMDEAWRNRRDDVLAQAAELEGAMRGFLEQRGAPAGRPPSPEVVDHSLAALTERYDAAWGGFGGAPKFPTPSNLFLLDELADESPRAARMLTATLDQMARGGIYDQLAGGFHRYATDREWKIPHFEKMLYDNGLLLELYAREHARTGDPEPARIVRETVRFLATEMSAPEGGFLSAIDAETHGHEGAYHVWTVEEIAAVLGPENAGFLAPLYGFHRAPFFEGTAYVLHLPHPLLEQADRRQMSREDLLEQIEPLKAKLLAARLEREPPAVDDKILTDWNGMAISGLAVAGRLLDEAAWVERAARAANFVWRRLRPAGGPLHHGWRQGEARNPAYLSDYVYFVRGLLALVDATKDERWLSRAAELVDEQIGRLGDGGKGFFAASSQPDILFRSKEVFDGAFPSANAVAVLNFLELHRLGGEPRWLAASATALEAFAHLVEEQIDGARMFALATRRFHAIAGTSATPRAPAADRPRTPLEDEAGSVLSARLEVQAAAGEGGGWRDFELEVELENGWHVYPPGSADDVRPVQLEAQGAELREVRFPPGRQGAAGGPRVYEGRCVIRGQLRPKADAEARLELSYQPCDASRCLPPSAVELPVD